MDKAEYAIPDFVPQNYSQQVAFEIARELNDADNLKFHLKVVNQLGPDQAKHWCQYVMEKPASSIKKSRAAYYAFMVRGRMSKVPKKTPAKSSKKALAALKKKRSQLADKMGFPR